MKALNIKAPGSIIDGVVRSNYRNGMDKVHERKTDGWLIKTAVASIAACISLSTWVYLTDRTEVRVQAKEQGLYIRSIAENVQLLQERQIVSYSQQQNTEARVAKVESAVEKVGTQLVTFQLQATKYWGAIGE